ncbi:uncharacterized protein LOC111024330 [Momordica charantia]|uniref:Uncharacterized protein LOC111024330 n=1 Tax=Momordica charantia TaxID=3673 RepID=A0A6J1DTZ4_MOMCH|nr:uncharacterized protein LOC111024330 [Momordica charantia]
MEKSSEQVKGSIFMAAKDKQKLFHTLLNQYMAEKSQGDQRVVLKKKIEELRSELEAANADLENVKRTKETIEQEIKGCEVELSLNETSIQTLEARISVLQREIASVGSELAGLKWDEGTTRDEFLNHMSDLNKKIREYQDKLASNDGKESDGNDTEESSPPSTEEMLVKVITQLSSEERDYQSRQDTQNQARESLYNLRKKLAAMGLMDKGRKDLKDMTRLSSGIEETFAHLSEELRKSCFCPRCKKDNMEALDNTLQVNDEGN